MKAADLTDQQVRDLLAAAMGGMAKQGCSCFIQDVNRAQIFFTYQEYDYYADGGPELYRCTFTLGDDYAVTLGDPERVIETKRYEPAPGDDEDDAATGMSAFSLDAGETVGADGFVERTGKVSETGDYPDKAISFNEGEFDAAVRDFQPVDMDVEHAPSVLDGNLGQLVSVWRKGAEMFGKFRIPAWLQSHFTKNGIVPKVSLTWDRGSKRIIGCAWVLTPRVEDAILMAAFQSGSTLPREGSKPTPDSPPPAARKATPMNPLKEIMRTIAAAFTRAADESPEDENPAAKTGEQHPPHPQQRVPGGSADMSKNAEFVAMQKKVAEMEERDLMNQATAWAEEEVAASRALPREKQRLAAAFVQAALDDKARPVTVTFAAADGSEAQGTRLDRLKADQAARPRHLLTEEAIPDDTPAFALPNRVKMSDEEEAIALLDLTPLGKKAKAAMNAEKGKGN